MRGSPEAVCAAIDEFCQEHQFLMNLGPHKSRIIETLIQQYKPRVFVEYGGYIGYSAIRLGAALRAYSSESATEPSEPTLPSYYVLERDASFAQIIMKFIKLAGLSDVVKVIVGESTSSILSLKTEGAFIGVDMVLFDHDESQYVADLSLLERLGLLQPGALVVADNVEVPGAPDYLKHLDCGKRSGKYESRKIDSYLPFGLPEPLEVTEIL